MHTANIPNATRKQCMVDEGMRKKISYQTMLSLVITGMQISGNYFTCVCTCRRSTRPSLYFSKILVCDTTPKDINRPFAICLTTLWIAFSYASELNRWQLQFSNHCCWWKQRQIPDVQSLLLMEIKTWLGRTTSTIRIVEHEISD